MASASLFAGACRKCPLCSYRVREEAQGYLFWPQQCLAHNLLKHHGVEVRRPQQLFLLEAYLDARAAALPAALEVGSAEEREASACGCCHGPDCFEDGSCACAETDGGGRAVLGEGGEEDERVRRRLEERLLEGLGERL